MGRPRKGAEPLAGTCLTPPASASWGSTPCGPRLKSTPDSCPPPTPLGVGTNHPCSAEHWRGLGLLPARAPTTPTPDQEKDAATAVTASPRGSENTDQRPAADDAPFGPAPLPAASRSPPRPSPRDPPARPTMACGRSSTNSSFTPLAWERGGVAYTAPENSSAAQPTGSPPPAPATSRSSRGSFRCLRGRRRRLGRRGRAGRGCWERPPRLRGVVTAPSPGAGTQAALTNGASKVARSTGTV